MDKPSDDYIAGFVDGEGCFALSMRRDTRHERNKKPKYYRWVALFVIVLRKDDKKILEMIKEHLDCGSVTTTKNNQARYQVGNLDDLNNIIVPFFKAHKLFGKKSKDFELWSQAIKILVKYKHLRGCVNIKLGIRGFVKVRWDQRDIDILYKIKNQMLVYKSTGQSNKWTRRFVGREERLSFS